MARLPRPGGDNGTWGDVLNDYLDQSHKPDGTIKDNAVTANTLAPNSVTNSAIASDAVNAASIADGSITETLLDTNVRTKLNAAGASDWDALANKPAVIAAGADQAAARTAIGAGTSNLALAGQGSATTAARSDHTQTASTISDSTNVGRAVLTATDGPAARTAIGAGTSNLIIGTSSTTAKAGDYAPTKADVGLGNVDNTADTAKPISTAQQTALDAKASLRKARTALAEGTVKGGNITVKPSAGSWEGLWSEWDWNNWIKPQVDRAKALGLNTIRILGAPEVVLNPATIPSQISQATYDSHWKQLAQYTQEQGMRLYPGLTEKWAFMGWTGAPNNFQDATVTASITSTAAALAEYQNVIGFDIFQEGSGSLDGLVLADVLALYAAIRAVAPGVPLTTSNSSSGFGSTAGFWSDASSLPYSAWTASGGADFVDIHVYLLGVNSADLDGFIERTAMPVLIGEFGSDQTLSSTDQVARYESARQLHQRPGVLGSFVWALADQGTSSANQAGVWDNTGFSQPSWPSPVGLTPLSTTAGQRTALVAKLHQFGSAPVPAQTQTRQPNKIPARASRPVNSTSGWLQGNNTYLFTDPKGLGIGAVAAGNTLATLSTQVSVSPSTPYKVEVEVLTKVAGRAVAIFMNSYDSSGNYLTTSPDATGTSGANQQTVNRLSGVFTSHSSAAFATIGFRMTGAADNTEWMIVLASPRPYLGAM